MSSLCSVVCVSYNHARFAAAGLNLFLISL